jgi:hypothetical protein
MAATRIVDNNLFVVEAALIDWLGVLRDKGQSTGPAADAFKRSGRARFSVALRWHLAAHRGNPRFEPDKPPVEQGIGLPTGPFTVWRRPSLPPGNLSPVGLSTFDFLLLGQRVVRFDRRLGMARVTVTHPAGTVIYGLTDPTDPRSAITQASVPAGTTQVELYGPGLAGLLLPTDATVGAVVGIPEKDYQAVSAWQPVEIVGLPVDPATWAGVGDHAQPQGLLPGLEPPRNAALHRLQRGAPVLGWDPEVAAGVAAPPWVAADPPRVLAEVDPELLSRLRDVLVRAQLQQALFRFGVTVPPPATLDGQQMPADPSTTLVSAISVLQLGVGTDPYLSLALGYGTNLDEPAGDPDVRRFHGGSAFDYMVTAPYAQGLQPGTGPVELTAYALRPLPYSYPPVPVSLIADHRAYTSPPDVDTDWAASTIVRWERPPKTPLFRVASSAAARHDAGAAATEPLMEARTAGGFHPIAPGLSPGDPEKNWLHVTDERAVIANSPGSRALRYSVANQNLFGLWSGWRGADHPVAQPAPQPPRVVSATLSLPAPASGTVCTGTLTVDLTWDWTDRRPATIRLLGRLYPAAHRGDGPPSLAVPSGLQRTVAGAQPAVVVQFTGDAALVDGVATPDLHYLNPAGDAEVSPGPAQSNAIRRYRLTVPGFSVDFAGTPHAGLALWADGTERLAPQHATAAAGPLLAFASNPIAPEMSQPIVPLGSMPDAQGRSHAKLSWPAVTGAAGYIIYEADELTLLNHYGAAEPAPDATLSERYQKIKDLVGPDPARRPFTRLTARPVTDTSLDVALPRGSRSIQCYLVITAGPGSTEGPWPAPDGPALAALQAVAAPRIAAPPPPELVASADPDTGVVSLTVRTRTGHLAERVDIHRVAVPDAARSLATMGPPIATVSTSGGGWSVTPDGTGTLTVAGTDAPGQSWRRIWYRALAWGKPDGLRGLVRGASAPSNPFSLVVPPATPPDLTPVTLTWPGGGLGDVQLETTSTVPVGPTALGPHRLELTVTDVTDPAAPAVLLSVAADLATLPATAPVSGHGVWRVGQAYRVIVRRSADSVVLRGVIRIVDPLGRRTERPIGVPAGPVLPAPDLADAAVVTVAGTGIVLTFTSGAPVVAPEAGPYVLTVRGIRPDPPGPPPPPRPFVVAAALSDIPVVTSIPAGPEPLALLRQRGRGPRLSYAAVARQPVASFQVTLASPDGRIASFTKEVS